MRWMLGVGSLALAMPAARLAFAQTTDSEASAQVSPGSTPAAASPLPPSAPRPTIDPSDLPPPPPPPRPPGLYTHDGFYLRFSIGPGLYEVATSPNANAVVQSAGVSGLGVAEFLAIGGTLPHGIVLAAATSGVLTSGVAVGNYGLLVDWFPVPSAGWHLGGELGIGLVSDVYSNYVVAPSTTNNAPNPDGSSAGLGATLIGGYDAWVTPQFSIGVNLMVMTTAFTKQTFSDASSSNLTPLAGGAMLSVLWH